jgi:hypothetical protein
MKKYESSGGYGKKNVFWKKVMVHNSFQKKVSVTIQNEFSVNYTIVSGIRNSSGVQ